MLQGRLHTALVAVLIAASAVVGCGGSAAGPVDEATARTVLRQTLDAWVGGKQAAELRTQTPEIIVVDQQWTDGAKLVDYEIVGTGSFDGTTLRAPANLTVIEPPSRTAKKQPANFTVGLQPVVTVVRVME
jgi:hypothetical protein